MTVTTDGLGASTDTVAPDGAVVVRLDELVAAEAGPASFDLYAGEVTIIVSRPEDGGPALMRTVAGLRAPDAGRVTIAGRDLAVLDPEDARQARYELVGYVLRDIGLTPELTVAQNIAAPLGLVRDGRVHDGAGWLARLARSLGFEPDLQRPAGALDPGTQQRVAIARALATRPALVYADEPIARLGERDGRVVLALLRTIAHEFGIAMVICTSDPALVGSGERAIAVRDGRVVGDRRGASAEWLRRMLDGDELGVPDAGAASPDGNGSP
ncbi:hypothetical protein GCM10011490_05550 [Pseudoclavibacter endophyticus]|uniref:ATP-binding cassette domain-containing protein n=1 Tax=Pseudoclavibacter endophyticus TaxID=1778590 RepID=A0A6H9WM65_9MICO|nr:ATP-binding cassette domain-containing protein [Pseudoclavibacter endophyticus]KAB1649946.1 ATP-binding cassette domain-containing protein [Pseudoclavibacter endophyticus]GGA58489.1 hypothetical protein GCM10011490_05550 [Pseudoclavibacter endophyticus]